MLDIDIALQMKVPSAFCWSPDGKRLLYQVSGPHGSDVLLHDFASGRDIPLVSGIPPYRLYKDKPDLRWTPEGDSVIYYGNLGYHLLRLDEQGQAEAQTLFNGMLKGNLFQLSPYQDVVAFLRDGEIWVEPVCGGEPMAITRGAGLLTDNWQHFGRLRQWPQWSPDGAWITYAAPMTEGFKVNAASCKAPHRSTSWQRRISGHS